MATHADVEAWLDGFTFMPGWSIEVRPPRSADSMYLPVTSLLIQHETKNADGPEVLGMPWLGHDDAKVASISPVPIEALPDRESFYRWLWAELVRRLQHEALEWMRYKGERIFDPHPRSAWRTAYAPDHYLLGT